MFKIFLWILLILLLLVLILALILSKSVWVLLGLVIATIFVAETLRRTKKKQNFDPEEGTYWDPNEIIR